MKTNYKEITLNADRKGQLHMYIAQPHPIRHRDQKKDTIRIHGTPWRTGR